MSKKSCSFPSLEESASQLIQCAGFIAWNLWLMAHSHNQGNPYQFKLFAFFLGFSIGLTAVTFEQMLTCSDTHDWNLELNGLTPDEV